MQEELASQLSERSGRTVSRGLIARWESNLERSRATPHPAHLIALANMTSTPWQTIFWFMDDAVPATRGVEYQPDGSRVLEPNFSDDRVEGFFSALTESEQKSPASEFAKMIETPSGLEQLRKYFENLADQERQESANTVFGMEEELKAVEFLANERPDAEAPILVARSQTPRGASSIKVARYEEDDPEATAAGSGVYFSRRGYKSRSADLSVEGDEGRASGSYYAEARRKREMFWGAVQWQMEEEYEINNVSDNFFQRISSGAISVRVNYFDNRNLIICPLFPSDEDLDRRPRSSLWPRGLTDTLAHLVLAEKIRGRTFRKLILCYWMKSSPSTAEFEERFSEVASNVQLLGVTLRKASGSGGVAKAMSAFIKEDGEQT